MVGEKWTLKFLVDACLLCSKAPVTGTATMLRFMISGMPGKHTQCLQMMFTSLILNYSSMFKVQSINTNHLKNQPEKCHEQLTKFTECKWLKQCLNQYSITKPRSVQHKMKSVNTNIFIVSKYYYLHKFAICFSPNKGHSWANHKNVYKMEGGI